MKPHTLATFTVCLLLLTTFAIPTGAQETNRSKRETPPSFGGFAPSLLNDTKTTQIPNLDRSASQGLGSPVTTNEQLNGVLWTQTSLEYRMSCEQVYALATLRLQQNARNTTYSAAVEQTSNPADLPAAVILDVDETVLDNSPFQARLVKSGENFSDEAWKAWVEEAKAELIPGARAFINYAMNNNIRVVFVTNRSADLEAKTIENLNAVLGIEVDEDSIHCKGEKPEWGSNKATRRKHVCESHRVIALLGDDYNDFAWIGKTSPEDRVAIGQQFSTRWGDGWFLLPNPLYGNWEKAFYNYDYGTSRKERLKLKYERLNEARN